MWRNARQHEFTVLTAQQERSSLAADVYAVPVPPANKRVAAPALQAKGRGEPRSVGNALRRLP
ncbi:hypothetical protein GCM10010416_73790 [Streptomyces caniferus]